MALYNFEKIAVVPTEKDFTDIFLRRTRRRRHPIVFPKGTPRSSIRWFYLRQIKNPQLEFRDKLSTVLYGFPQPEEEDIHPFYLLYNKDDYKLALGQVNTAMNLIRKVARFHLEQLKSADTLRRCKSLKLAALRGMLAAVTKIGPSLAYLEQVRQHMSRLRWVDPNALTILICGYPNVGKTSFINKIARAALSMPPPYALTTESLFVGRTDYKHLRYQVVDTGGIFEDTNTSEMCSFTALAHLRAAVLFLLDISGSCGHSIAEQAALFHSIKPLFMNKPLIIACNKTDLQPLEGLSEEDMKLVMEMKAEAMKTVMGQGGDPATDAGVLVTMSSLTGDGVTAVRNSACERLLDQRVEAKDGIQKDQ